MSCVSGSSLPVLLGGLGPGAVLTDLFVKNVVVVEEGVGGGPISARNSLRRAV